MNKTNLHEEHEILLNKANYKKEFLDWNKNFTKKFNKIILLLLLINTLMVLPISLYCLGTINSLASVTGTFYIGFYGLIGGAATMTAAFLGNITLIANRIYLNQSLKNINKKTNKYIVEVTTNNLEKKAQSKITSLNIKQPQPQKLPYAYNPNFVILSDDTKETSKITKAKAKIKEKLN